MQNRVINIGLVLFIILSFYNILRDIRDDLDNFKNIESLQNTINKVSKNSDIVLELQRERGLTSIYYANSSKEHLNKMLQQRKQTQTSLKNISVDIKESLKNIRNEVEKNQKGSIVFSYYSQLINRLLLDTKSLTFNTNSKVLKNELIVYNHLNFLQETLGNIRAKVGIVLSANRLIPEHIKEIKRRDTLFNNQLEIVFADDIILSNKYARQISKTKCLKKSLRFYQNLNYNFSDKNLKLSALEWFELSTCAVDAINAKVTKQLKTINENIEKDLEIAHANRVKYIIFWFFGFIILSVFVIISFKKSQALKKEQTLLKNYKKAIDFSTLVSTTDINNIITYVNKNFCVISGYTKQELIGKDFSTVVDSDSYRDVYKDISTTLKSGKKWHGLLKNKKKHGDIFWVDTSIIPILDDKDKLVEYITIRHDVSDIVTLKDEIQETQRELLYRLGEAVESKNKKNKNHIKRIALYSKRLAQLANLSNKECETIFAASSMHDVGKIAIPDNILLKPGKLTNEEWLIMKTHSQIGYNLFKDSKRTLLRTAAVIAHEHHEKFDGNGYPRGIKGKEISIYGRIVAIVDVFDALLTKRVYKDAWLIDDVVALLKDESEKQFDPELVKLFIDNLDDFLKIRDSLIE